MIILLSRKGKVGNSAARNDKQKTGSKLAPPNRTMTTPTMMKSRVFGTQILLCLLALFQGAHSEIRPLVLDLEPAVSTLDVTDFCFIKKLHK